MTFCTLANFGLAVGAFELSLETGELNFRTGVNISGFEPDEALIRHLVYQNVVTFDKYLPALTAVLEQGVDHKQIIAELNNPQAK